MGFSLAVKSSLPKLGPKARKLASQVVRKATLDVEAHAKANAPVDTGFLRNSIQAQETGELSGEVTVGADYGIFVELGTSRMAAQPYLGPAVEAVRPGFEAAAAAVLKRATE